MDRSTDFQPVWPPVDDDDFVRLPEMRKARRMYRGQKDELRGLAEQMKLAAVGTGTGDESRRIATMLHNIAGTAAHFDDGDFGLFAARLEQPARSAFTAELLRSLCMKILAGFGPQIDF